MSTTLEAYMAREGIDDAALAARIGRERSTVSKIRRGKLRPTLEIAALIEGVTNGSVPMQSWVEAA
jgi:transcriptional regulator with XRE-family HTH domain